MRKLLKIIELLIPSMMMMILFFKLVEAMQMVVVRHTFGYGIGIFYKCYCCRRRIDNLAKSILQCGLPSGKGLR